MFLIDFVRETPAWIIDHPWWTALGGIAALAGFTSLILLNPDGKQLRNIWRRK